MKKYSFLIFPYLLFGISALAQQRPDTTFIPNVTTSLFQKDSGPIICIDSAHNNLHTLNGGFAPFARLMRSVGFRVEDRNAIISDKTLLSVCDIYAIINSLHKSNLGNWRLPNPSAFTNQEITEINEWVKEGGRLFLVADHMPFGGAAFELAKSFGFEFSNGFARLEKEGNQPDYFSIENGRLLQQEFFGDEINSVTSFTGSAFTYPDEANIIMKFKTEDVSLEPEIAWQFTDSTKTISLENYAQGAVFEYGEGKILVFGEAAMFTAQKVRNQNGTFRVGFNSSNAPNNQLFIIRLMEYLVE